MNQDLSLLIIRLGFGGTLLIAHGIPKMLHFSQKAMFFPDPLHIGSKLTLILAVTIEVGIAAALIVGLFTRWMAIPAAVLMLVALVFVHGMDPWARKELAFLCCGAFSSLFFSGGGRFSLDTVRQAKRP